MDVLVVGAGIAGLAAARAVSAAGRDCLVLEARDRVGGRIHTSAEWPGYPVDLGASWLHGQRGNPVYDEVRRLGLETAVFDVGSFDGGGESVLYAPDGARLDDEALQRRLEAVLADLEERDAPPEESLAAAIASLPAARDPAVAAGLSVLAGDYGATPDQLALSALAEEDSLPGAQLVLPGGYGQLTDRLAEGLPVRLGTAVTQVSLADPERVVVTTGAGRWTARRVIVTVPLGVLKAGSIRFDPPLPGPHRRAIEALGFGRYEKLLLRFDEVFWDDVDDIAITGPPGAPFTGWYNLDRVSGAPVLMALNGGVAAAAVDGMSAQQQAALAATTLSAVYPRFRDPVAAQASAWWTDEFSRGSYSFTAVGSDTDDRLALGTPVAGRLWLAGEAVHPAWHSTVHGGWASGRDAAEQALA